MRAHGFGLEAAIGFEPMNNGFADRCLATWLCRPASKGIWSGKRDSNPRQPRWQRGALPTELFPLKQAYSIAQNHFVNSFSLKSSSPQSLPNAVPRKLKQLLF
jgi:hypothetical protein